MHLHRAVILCVTLSLNGLGQQAYYPLTVGNRLTFSGSGPWSQLEITSDTLMPNGQVYVAFADPTHVMPKYQRQEGPQVLQYDPVAQAEYVFFDFSMDEGDTILSRLSGPTDTLDVILLQRDTVVMFNRILRHWVFGFDIRKLIDDEHAFDVVDSIGITELSLAWGFNRLTSAIIDGIAYTTVSVEQNTDLVPRFVRLDQNFPNPFNPVTMIRFSLPKEAVASLEVYDALGRLVRHLHLGQLAHGDHEITFDAAGLASGVYIYRLVADELSETRRFVLLR